MDRKLRFRDDGTFTIVQFTDLHWQNGEPADLKTRDLMRKAIQEERPDLIVLTGDLIYSPKCVDPRRSLRDALAVAADSGIPWAAVFGNHDAERDVSRKQLMDVLQKMQGNMAIPGPASVHGVGNYSIRLTDRGGNTAAALYFLDSGSLSEVPGAPGYDWIRPSQIDWFRAEARRLGGSRDEAGVPGLAFFHIPLPEYDAVWRTQKCYGRKREQVGCPRVNSGFFAAAAAAGSLMGTFCGHDHNNDYGGKLMDTWLYYGRSSGYQTYGRWGFSRGARVIRLKAGTRSFDTWVRLHSGLVIRHPPVHWPWMYRLGEKLRRLF